MAPKRAAASLPLRLTSESQREDVLYYLEHAVGLPHDIIAQLDAKWRERGELINGEMLLELDEQLLINTGMAPTVARKVVKKVREQQAPSTQALAPTTQQMADGGGDAGQSPQQQQQPEQQQQQEQPAKRRRGRNQSPTPAATTQNNGDSQATQANGHATSQQPEQQPVIKPDPEQWEQQLREEQAAAAAASGPPRRSGRHRSQPPGEQQQQQQQAKQEPFYDDDMGEAGGHFEEQGEGEEEEDVPTRRSRARSGSAFVKDEPGAAAMQEQPAPLSAAGGRSTRHTSHGGPSAAAAAAGAGGSQEEGQGQGQEQGRADGEEAGGSGRMLTRRQRQQAELQHQRQLRQSTVQERKRREEAEEDSEDLGPAADRELYFKDWKKRAQWGMHEVFSSMTVDELRTMVEAQEEWPELAQNCLTKKVKVDGINETVELKRSKQIATKLVNFLFTGSPEGRETEEGGLNKAAMKELLKGWCDDAVQSYLHDKLKLRFQNVPYTNDHHKLMWKLWHHPEGFGEGAAGERDVQEFPVLLGKRTLEYSSIQMGANLEPAGNGLTAWRATWQAVQNGNLVLADMGNDFLWMTQVQDLSTLPKVKVSTRLIRQPEKKKVVVYIYQLFDKKSPAASQVTGTWKRESLEEPGQEEVVAVDLYWVLSKMDGFEGTPFMDEMDSLDEQFKASAAAIEGKGLATELGVEAPLNLKQFDKVMACVEDIDRGEPAGFKEECDQALLLELRPYQRRALAHMLQEERAQPTASRPGGSARHLWVKLNLPDNPEVHCFVSPILHQIRTSISHIGANQWMQADGGAGWIALQMGMGKTACAVGAMQMNPPPQGWRKNRAYQTLRARDHLASVLNNMPHGGTLIVMPPTLIDQWEDEIRKTTDHPFRILKWTDTTKKDPRTENCREIAKYDIVLTTFSLASNLHTLSSIRWWRIIVDEPQLGAGGFLQDKEHTWYSNHRWLLTGTPINHAVDTMTPSMEFLKLGNFDALYNHYPAVSTHVLKTFMVRHTKQGMLDGEINLNLLKPIEKLVECRLNDDDEQWYRILEREQRHQFRAIIQKARLDPDRLGADQDPNWEWDGRAKLKPTIMMRLRGQLNPLRQAASSALGQLTGEEHYDDEKGVYVKEKHWYQSKAEAVIELLAEKKPEEKVLIFSEYPQTLRAIKALLADIGLQSRNLIGSTSAALRGQAIRQFQTDPPTKVFLLTYRAGGAGITLTAGTHIILCEPTLNPSFERQAIGRSHRMGQTKQLTVTRFLMMGTVEEKVAAFVARQQEEEGEDPEEVVESTAMEANLASHDESNKLQIEDLRDMIHDIAQEEVGEADMEG